jgi:hypothetical protein
LVKRAVGKGNKAAKLAEHIELTYPNNRPSGDGDGDDDNGGADAAGTAEGKNKVNNPHWCEVELDVSKSALGNRVLGVVTTYIQSVSIDLGFMVEGVSSQELPERVLGALRFHSLDIPNAPYLPFLDTSTMHNVKDSAALDEGKIEKAVQKARSQQQQLQQQEQERQQQLWDLRASPLSPSSSLPPTPNP